MLAACATGPAQELVIADPTGDDHGPGSYVYPSGDLYARGAFDLRAVSLRRRGDDLDIAVRFARPVPVARGVRLSADRVADVFLPTVDIYLDLAGDVPRARAEALPGRRAVFCPSCDWDVAIVLTAVPERVRATLEAAGGTDATVVVPRRVVVAGDTLRARVPAVLIGSHHPRAVGVAAAVTSTVFATTFRSLVPGQLPNAFVRDVTASPGRCGDWEEAPNGTPCTFGGCTRCDRDTRVIDALHPEAGVQERALSGVAGEGALGEIPFVHPPGYVAPAGPAPARAAAVVDQRGAIVTARVEGTPPVAGTLVDGLDPDGRPTATLVVTAIHDGGLVILRVVERVGGSAGSIARIRLRD